MREGRASHFRGLAFSNWEKRSASNWEKCSATSTQELRSGPSSPMGCALGVLLFTLGCGATIQAPEPRPATPAAGPEIAEHEATATPSDTSSSELEHWEIAGAYFERFLELASGDADFAAAIDRVRRRCQSTGASEGDERGRCIPGYIQEMPPAPPMREAMQREMEAMQREEARARDETDAPAH